MKLLFLFLFLVASNLPAAQQPTYDFPKPAPDKTFPELKVYDAGGRPWRVAQEDWAGAKKKVLQDSKWAAWLKTEQSEVDSWMAKHQDRITWICGWWHDSVSPKDGSMVVWEDKIPGEEVQFFHSASDPKIEITPKLMGGWVFMFRSNHTSRILRAARLYRLTGDEKYAAWAAAQLDFYADSYLKWPLSTRKDGARMYWQTLDEATTLAKFADVIRLLGNYVKPERKAQWWTSYFKPQSDVLLHGPAFQIIHNIAMWHRSGVAQIAMVYNDVALTKEAIDGPLGVREQIAKGITGDYFEWEQSFGYNSYFVMAASGLFEEAGLLGRAEELKDEMCIIENLLLSPLYIRFPDGNLPLTADVINRIIVPSKKLFADYYRIYPTAIGLEEAATRRDWNTLLDPPTSAHRKAELPAVTSRLMESTRMALLKQGDWQIFFHFGQLTESHSQREGLNFMAYYGKTDIIHDPGTVGYGSPLHKGYYTRAISHNVALVDGEGMETTPQYGKLIEYKPNKVSASLPQYRSDTAVTRTLSVEGEQLKDILTIETSGTTARRLASALHLQGKVKLDEKFVADPNFANAPLPTASFSHLKNPKVASYKDKAQWIVDYNGVLMKVAVVLPGAFKVWHSESPDFPPQYRDCLYIEQAGTKAVFTTTISPVGK